MKFSSVGTFNELHPTAKAMLEAAPFSQPWELSLEENRLGFQRRLRDIAGPMQPIHSIETLHAQGPGQIGRYNHVSPPFRRPLARFHVLTWRGLGGG